jgi:hypothetical protein
VPLVDNEVLEPLGFGAFLFEAEKTRSVEMVLIKVRYDAYNRQFTLLDQELTHTLDDGENYLSSRICPLKI